MSKPDYKPVPGRTFMVSTAVGEVERIVVCAANLCDDGVILCGARHWDSVMRRQADACGWDDRRSAEQGFIDQWGNFMDRQEAAFIVRKNNQKLRCDKFDDELYSENLY